MHHNPKVLSASTIDGDNVRNAQGEKLGEIKDLMIDLDTGKVSYAVLSFGGFLGLGDKLFAIPWEAFSLDADSEEFVLNVSKEKLKDAPGFDKNDWPNFSDRSWSENVYSYYGYNINR